MTRSTSGRRAVGLLALAAAGAAACTRGAPAPVATPPAPAAATAPAHVHAAAPADTPVQGAAADVRFLQQMLGHHAQALVMTRLVPQRTARTDLHRLAERIDVSQRDEIDQMGAMLRRRGAAVPDDTGHAAHGAHATHGTMPGMLTPAGLERLTAATGPAFERLFLEGMIRHHEGALVMVRDYLGTPGVAQDPLLFQFANDIDADQRAEIRRMRALLDAMPRQP